MSIKKTISIAIIDDFALIRTQLKSIMLEAGFTISFDAEDGESCLQKLSDCVMLPDAFILDVDMPRMNGLE